MITSPYPDPRELETYIQSIANITNNLRSYMQCLQNLQEQPIDPQILISDNVKKIFSDLVEHGGMLYVGLQVNTKRALELALSNYGEFYFVCHYRQPDDHPFNPLEDEVMAILVHALETNKTIKKICFYGGFINQDQIYIAEMLQQNKTLEDLSLKNCNITPEGLNILVAALEKNTTLLNIEFPRSHIVDRRVLNQIDTYIKRNRDLSPHYPMPRPTQRMKAGCRESALDKTIIRPYKEGASYIKFIEDILHYKFLDNSEYLAKPMPGSIAYAFHRQLYAPIFYSPDPIYKATDIESISAKASPYSPKLMELHHHLGALQRIPQLYHHYDKILSQIEASTPQTSPHGVIFQAISWMPQLYLDDLKLFRKLRDTAFKIDSDIFENAVISLKKELENFHKIDLSGVFHNTVLEINPIAALTSALLTNQTVKTIYLDRNYINDAKVGWMEMLIKENKTLETISLAYNEITTIGAIKLANALETNSTLLNLDLSYNYIEDQSVLEKISYYLSRNRANNPLSSSSRIKQSEEKIKSSTKQVFAILDVLKEAAAVKHKILLLTNRDYPFSKTEEETSVCGIFTWLMEIINSPEFETKSSRPQTPPPIHRYLNKSHLTEH